jgi:hypothetical protein
MVSATIIFPFLFFLLLALLVSGEESEKCRECRKVVAELVHLHRSGNQPQQLLEVARTVLCSKELADFKERPFSFCRAAGDPKYKEAWYFEVGFF